MPKPRPALKKRADQIHKRLAKHLRIAAKLARREAHLRNRAKAHAVHH